MAKMRPRRTQPVKVVDRRAHAVLFVLLFLVAIVGAVVLGSVVANALVPGATAAADWLRFLIALLACVAVGAVMGSFLRLTLPPK